ncbi:hypothetical protein HMPREF6485_2818 [Segatella buccae ATCC 33574]|uniref:Uncharacterized protein n=1 Tax=Segatella buccae ATCC 33574 TaxID=873513 RepID=E6KB31_9BACT|nr:hypothetical protein HMPREF6485_2818 [Segatella buccae ATCC 33574]
MRSRGSIAGKYRKHKARKRTNSLTFPGRRKGEERRKANGRFIF